MIEVNDLVKRYSGYEAVRGISFSVKKGETVGFLGPNGAGKSTTMRILTGYLPSTSGDVKVGGMDLLTQSMEVRKKIGYMPEHVPLYLDMRVSDYLEYRAALKGVTGKNVRKRVAEAMGRCGVADVSHKVIGTLSKGYRQRVGLADAMVHDPELLILDEPTAGLDPKQIRSVRDLITEIGKDHTILLSTHILSEVEMTCNRAIIINRGRIEASDTLENLGKRVQSGSLFLEVKASKEAVKSSLEKPDEISSFDFVEEKDGWIRVEAFAKPGEDIRETVDELVKREKWPLREFRYLRPSLEDIFVELTQD